MDDSNGFLRVPVACMIWFMVVYLCMGFMTPTNNLFGQLARSDLGYKPEDATGASLKTDPELESILETAERYREDENYRLATKLWQAVLQRSGDTLYSSDGKEYRSLVRQVEMLLAALPPEGLKVYRIDADANARQLLADASPESETNALSQIVRLHFLSSEGDDAALRLAAIYMDRYDFIGARRLLEKIIDVYPDPSVSLYQVRVRLALCASFLDEEEQAKKYISDAKGMESGFDEKLRLVESSIGKLKLEDLQLDQTNWTMTHGNVQRFGVMPALPKEYLDAPNGLGAKWQYYFEPRDHYVNFADTRGRVLVGPKARRNQGTFGPTEEKQLKLWRDRSWRPAGHLVLDGERVYFKTGADLVVWDLKDIERVVQNPSEAIEPAWRSLWRNCFSPDAATLLWRGVRLNFSSYGRRNGIDFGDDPQTDSEIQVFADQIYQRMSIIDGVVYSIEGERFDGRNKPENRRPNAAWNAVFRRSRVNYLSAFDAKTGQALWQIPRPQSMGDEKDKNDGYLTGGGFMSAPIKFGAWLLLPLNEGGAISVVAVDPAQEGKTVWKSFLCDEPESSSAPQAPITMSLEGSDLFVNCGVGVLFLLDPATGTIRFAKRYTRKGTVSKNRTRIRQASRPEFDGWSEDIIIPFGRQMICFSSDSSIIHSYDRFTGETIWYMDRESHYGLKTDYLLGVVDNVLYAGGSHTIMAIDLEAEGSLLWGGNNLFGESTSYGKGMLTKEGLFVPVGSSVFHFGLKDKDYEPQLLRKIPVDLGNDAPLGNLFSDGQRIWVHGGTRLYGLWPVDATSDEEVSENQSGNKTENKKSSDR